MRTPRAKDWTKAVRRWELFHGKDFKGDIIRPNKRVRRWPKLWGYAGPAKTIFYRSDKWYEDGQFDYYYHDHKDGIGLWQPRNTYKWLEDDSLPKEARPLPQHATVLGECWGWVVERHDTGELVEAASMPDDLWCCAPDGRMLFAFSPTDGVLCVIAGPGLRVEPRGVVG
jgi:hypothetical protein